MSNININKYKMELQINDKIVIAVVSDLHEREFDEIIDIIKSVSPTVILLPGDTLERRNEGVYGHTKKEIDKWQNTSTLWKIAGKLIKILRLNKKNDLYAVSGNGMSFIKNVSSLAPVIFSVGNHEWYLTEEDKIIMEEKNVIILDNANKIININNNIVNFGGLSTRYDLKWLRRFANQSGLKILLCHHPEYYFRFIKNTKLDKFDIIISGHAHGGQCRLFNHGLFAPGQGFFPKYTKGKYGKLLISTGIANTSFFPRIVNPPEVCIIEIRKK